MITITLSQFLYDIDDLVPVRFTCEPIAMILNGAILYSLFIISMLELLYHSLMEHALRIVSK